MKTIIIYSVNETAGLKSVQRIHAILSKQRGKLRYCPNTSPLMSWD